MFHISLVVTLRGGGFTPSESLLSTGYLERTWRPGDFALPGEKGPQFDDSGVAFRMLHKYGQTDWMETVMAAFQEVSALISDDAKASNLPMPLVSIQVATDGQDYPPLYLDRQFMVAIESMKAELDIDVIACL